MSRLLVFWATQACTIPTATHKHKWDMGMLHSNVSAGILLWPTNHTHNVQPPASSCCHTSCPSSPKIFLFSLRLKQRREEKWNVACGRVRVAHDGEESRKMGMKRLILGADPRWWRSIAPFRRNLRKEKREMRKVLIAWDLESEKMVAQARFPEADNGAEVNSISWWSTT